MVRRKTFGALNFFSPGTCRVLNFFSPEVRMIVQWRPS
eukprot:COSAG06_NODE_53426_length_300_cov_0.766169_1_plen_37_part_01